MPKFNQWLFGTKDKIKRANKLNPEQDKLLQLINDGLNSGKGQFGDIFGKFDENAFNEGIKNPALKEFWDDIIPRLQESFIGNNQVGGSGFQRARTKAAADLQSKLAGQKYNAQQTQTQNRLQGAQLGLAAQPFENIYKQGTTGFANEAGAAAINAAVKSGMGGA